MIGLANKKEEFIAQDMEVLQPFVSTCGTMIIALRLLQEQSEIQTEKERIQQQLLTAQSIAKMGSWEYDAATNETRWSDELYRIFELPLDGKTLNYKAYHSRIDPEDFDLNETIVAQAIDSGRSYTFEERLVFPDGRKKTVLVNGTPLLDAEGKVMSIQGITQDITLHKRQEMEVQRFFDLAVDLFCIASADGHFLRTSRSFASTLGFSESELKEIPFFDFVHPDDKKATENEMDFIINNIIINIIINFCFMF
jgi:PAS domain S-box-containing protein